MPEKRLYRSTADRRIAGVAAGVADYFGVDATAVRAAWLVSVVFAGVGLLLYVVLWIVLPEEPDGLVIGSDRSGSARRGSAVAIAEERYARGEITADELREIRRNLSDSP